MWRFHLKDIAGAKIEVSDTGQRILTVYTPLAIEMHSPDWERFRLLRAKLLVLADPRKGFDEVRIATLHSDGFDQEPYSLYELGDPIV